MVDAEAMVVTMAKKINTQQKEKRIGCKAIVTEEGQ